MPPFSEQIAEALLGAGIELAPPFVHLLAAGVENWAAEIRRMGTPPTAAGTVVEIIRGVDDNPALADLPDNVKREYVRGAVARYIEMKGGTPDDGAINTLIELALQAQGLTH